MTTHVLARILAWLIAALLVAFILACFVYIGWMVYLVAK